MAAHPDSKVIDLGEKLPKRDAPSEKEALQDKCQQGKAHKRDWTHLLVQEDGTVVKTMWPKGGEGTWLGGPKPPMAAEYIPCADPTGSDTDDAEDMDTSSWTSADDRAVACLPRFF